MLNNVNEINFYNEEYPENWLVISDLHILPKEPKNRKNLIPNIITLLNEIIEIGKRNKIRGVIFLGDIFDRSFTSVNAEYLSEIFDIFKRMSDEFKLFAVYGNHELTYYKDNPYYIITDIKSERVLNQIKDLNTPKFLHPYIQVIDNIDYGNVIINFIHFSKEDKEYKVNNIADGKINICLYHDSFINFESEEKLYHHRIGHGINVIKTDIFENVDWAICGDTHTPLNTFILNNKKQTIYDVPGVMTIRTVADKHTSVKCPIISIGNKGLLRQYITLNIGDYDETISKEEMTKANEKKELTKILKKVKKDDSYIKQNYQDFLNSFTDLSEKQILIDPKTRLKSEIVFENIQNGKEIV